MKFIRIYGNTAYAVYRLTSDIRENGDVKTMTWNESSIFRKVNGVWKVELIHSTPIETK
jgi:Domain of unknown function (DUF4440)